MLKKKTLIGHKETTFETPFSAATLTCSFDFPVADEVEKGLFLDPIIVKFTETKTWNLGILEMTPTLRKRYTLQKKKSRTTKKKLQK